MVNLSHMSTGLPTIYHDKEYNLYYIFTESGQLDLTTIRNIHLHGWSLYSDGDSYAVKNNVRELKWYSVCSRQEFINWYEGQKYMYVFIRANGIPGHFCRPLPTQEDVRHEQIILQPRPRPEQPNYRQVIPSAPPAQQRQNAKPTKPHIVTLVLKHDIQEKRICPITHDPITENSTCIAPCYHSFDTEAITCWLQTNSTCPECREVCV